MLKYEIKKNQFKKFAEEENETIKRIRIKFGMKKNKEGWNWKNNPTLKIIISEKKNNKKNMDQIWQLKKLKGDEIKQIPNS